MSDVFGSIEPGSNIRIQRSDGRIHAAVVSGLNPETHSLTVEWFEKGDTKGKEIEASIVKELNSEFFRNDNAMRRANSKTDMPNDSQHTSKNHAIPTAVSKRKPRIAKENIPLHSENDHISGKEENNDESAPVSARSRDSKIPAIANRRPTSRHASSASVSTPPIVTNAAAPAPAAKQTNINSNIRRKSNCVKEVERLQKERQERRENQNKLKEEKDQLMAGFKLVNQLNSGGNNPNWEFLKMINDYRSQLEFSSLRPDDAVVDHQICVCVRKRPLNGKERKRSEIDVITIPDKQNTLVHEPKVKVDLTKYVENQTFRFDYSFDENSDNKMVYKYTAQPLVNCIFEGGMATCFAYGQTGSGKTHTMGGDFSGKVQECNKGIYAYAATDIFKYNATRYKHYNLMVSASFFEIYSGKVFDLLSNKKRLEVLEDGKQEVHIKGLTEVVVNSVDDVLQLIQLGNHIRTSGTTSMNNHSSRSHAVFQIILRQSNSNNKLHGKLSLIDLAGNERGKDTISSDRVTRFEGAEINKSLLALKECIRALGRNGAHLPFRASKLTQVLRDSFIGDNARTCIAMISPCFSSCEHTLNTLRYANRVKELGAIDPLENRKLDRIEENNDSGSVIDTSNISDLDMIRTNKDDDVDENWYEMIPLADELKELEEKVIDQHRDLVRHMQSKLDTHIRLLESSDTVEYDVEDYVSRLDNLLDSVLDKAMRVKEEVTEFRMKMKQEEETAQAISVRNKNRKH